MVNSLEPDSLDWSERYAQTFSRVLLLDIYSSLLSRSTELRARACTRFLTTLAWNWQEVGQVVVTLDTSKNMTSEASLATRLTSERSPREHAYSAHTTSPGPWDDTRVTFPHQSCLTASTLPSSTTPRLSTGSPLRTMNSPGEYL